VVISSKLIDPDIVLVYI